MLTKECLLKELAEGYMNVALQGDAWSQQEPAVGPMYYEGGRASVP